MSMELSVQGKNAIVTGAAGNIGEACVRALAAAGANVLVADMDAAAAERTVEKLQKEYPDVKLVPQVCDATHLPVLAAGGIGDGRGVAAAFMLGAQGVQVGTRFLVAEECGVHPNYKKKVLKANDIATMVTGKRLGHPVRSLRTNFARNYAKAEYGGMDDEALEALGSGALRKAVVEGDLEEGCFLSGQVAAMVNKIQPAAEIVREVIEGAEPVLKGATQWVK